MMFTFMIFQFQAHMAFVIWSKRIYKNNNENFSRCFDINVIKLSSKNTFCFHRAECDMKIEKRKKNVIDKQVEQRQGIVFQAIAN